MNHFIILFRLNARAGVRALLAGRRPVLMMKTICDITRERHIHTVVSLNSIMVDGTGMCGACRVIVGGATRFACVDGPEFDGADLDFQSLIDRSRAYEEFEDRAREMYAKEKSSS